MVRDRWLKSYQIQVPGSEDLLQSDLPDVSLQSDQIHLNISKLQKKPLKATLSQNQKYKKALEIGQKIAGVASLMLGKCFLYLNSFSVTGRIMCLLWLPQKRTDLHCKMSYTLNFESLNGDFVQILNCARNHWICISTVGRQAGKTNV